MKPGPIIAALIVIGALAFGALAFKSSLTPYLPFKQAKEAASTATTVQIMGAPVKGDTRFDQSTGSLNFVLRENDTSETMPVVFKSPKPDNFDEAIKVTAIGHYDPAAQEFRADNLLVKCPSKYAGDPSGGQDRSYDAS